MNYVQVFFIGLVFSFLGSIPPGTLNLSILQLGLEKKVGIAMRFALAVSIVEYPYTWIGVQFEYWITTSPAVIENFQLITAVVMTVIGLWNIWLAQKPADYGTRFNESGFRQGIVLSILNPMAIPYWIGITAYLKAQGWIDLHTTGLLHSYVLGTAVGSMVLLTLYIFLAKKLAAHVTDNRLIKLIPGFTLILLGIYAFVNYLF